jgi:hypothetical protein
LTRNTIKSFQNGDVGECLSSEVIRNIDLINQRVGEIRNEIDKLAKSELFVLKKKFDDAKLENRDFLVEMATCLHQKNSAG